MPVMQCMTCMIILLQSVNKNREVSEASRNISAQTSSIPEPITNSTATIDPTPIVGQPFNWLPIEIAVVIGSGIGLFFLVRRLIR